MANDAWSDELAGGSPVDRAATTRGTVDASLVEQRFTQSSPRVSRMVIILASICVLMDFSMCPILASLQQTAPGIVAAGYSGLMGTVLGQGNLLAAWLVWSEGPFLRRLVWHWVVIAALFCAWALGGAIAVPAEVFAPASVTVGLAVPLVSVAAQFPIWVTRQWFGWRLMRPAIEEAIPQEPPLTIRGLMGATVIVAMALALTRMVPLPMAMAQRRKELAAAWIVGFLLAAGISTIGMLPAGRMLLGMPRFRMALIWSGVYAAGLISLVWIVRELMIRYALNGGPPILPCAMLSSLMLGYAATLIVAGCVARAWLSARMLTRHLQISEWDAAAFWRDLPACRCGSALTPASSFIRSSCGAFLPRPPASLEYRPEVVR